MSFEVHCGIHQNTATVHLSGDLDSAAAGEMRSALALLDGRALRRVIFDIDGLSSVSAAGARGLVMAQQRISAEVDVIVLGAGNLVSEHLAVAGFGGAATVTERAN